MILVSQQISCERSIAKFGLTEDQATLYLLLVQHGELRIHELAEVAQIPRSSVYYSLKGLLELGLIEEVIDDNFKRVRSYPIGLLRHHLEEQQLELEKLTKDLDKLQETLTLLPNNTSVPSTTVRYYKDISGARQLLWNTLKTKDTIYVYSTWGRGRAVGLKFYKNFVSESHQRAIKEKVLINPTVRALDSIRRYHGSAISRTRINDIRALSEESIVIKGETFIYDSIYAQIYLRGQEIDGFEIESHSFTETQRSLFETLWHMAKPISEYL